MKMREIAQAIGSVFPTAYSLSVRIAPRGDGRECWRLIFPTFGGADEVELFYPVGDEKEDRETLEELTVKHANRYLADAGLSAP